MDSMTATRVRRRPAGADAPAVPQSFYRDMVWPLPHRLLAVTRDGHPALLNAAACRIFGLPPSTSRIGRPYTAVLRDGPDVARIVGGAFEMSRLPSRAGLRVKRTGK